MVLSAVWESLRPHQWTKNFFILSALIFSHNLIHPLMVFKAVAAFIIFCFLSSSIYLINDYIDADKDKLHPLKSKRPIPSGRLPKSTALLISLIMASLCVLGAFFLSLSYGFVALTYFLLFCLYSVKLKEIVILDVMTIAMGFVLRVVGGAFAINVQISNWFLLCTILLALFLGFSKRRQELVLLEKGAVNHRSTLAEYSPYFLDQMIAVVTASTLMAYSLYTMAPETIEKFHTRNLSWTIPFVLYGIFRYLYLVHQKAEGGDPGRVIFTDRPFMINTLLWLLTAIVIIYL
ncbi:MAG: decaprenyl-phosphate phosphoribosyltransferase [Candidatus Schekmanbacteria bacterium]|nr:decaprenyl-phosphate phosphoribosyltransferase [Candidatus Schekmanbacteria bacterium]